MALTGTMIPSVVTVSGYINAGGGNFPGGVARSYWAGVWGTGPVDEWQMGGGAPIDAGYGYKTLRFRGDVTASGGVGSAINIQPYVNGVAVGSAYRLVGPGSGDAHGTFDIPVTLALALHPTLADIRVRATADPASAVAWDFGYVDWTAAGVGGRMRMII